MPKAVHGFGSSILDVGVAHLAGYNRLEDELGTVLKLPRVESADGTSSLGKGVIRFADVDSIKEVEDIQAELKPLLFAQRDTTGEAEVHGSKVARTIYIPSQIAD